MESGIPAKGKGQTAEESGELMRVRIYGTEDAVRIGHKFEDMLVVAEMQEGMLLYKGEGHLVFLPTDYLNRYYYHYA